MKKQSDRFVLHEGDIEVIKQGVPYVLKKDRNDHDKCQNENELCIDDSSIQKIAPPDFEIFDPAQRNNTDMDRKRHEDGPDAKKKSKK